MTSSITNKTKQLPPGVYCPVVSLYQQTKQQDIDTEATYKYFNFLIRAGCHGLVLSGSTAEAVLLTPEERQEAIRIARKAAQDLGLGQYPLVSGVSGQSTNESIQLAKQAAQAGADFGLLLPPSYWSKAVSKSVITNFYKDVADESPIPIVVYNFPGVTAGIDLNSDVLSELAQHPNIVGVKLTCGNAGKVTRLAQEYTPAQFSVFAGQSDWLVPCLAGGGVGCVTGVGNIFPKSVVHLYELWQTGKIKEATHLQGLVAQAEKACKEGLAATKFGAGYYAGPVSGVTNAASFLPRRPYEALPKVREQWVIDAMGILVDFENSLPDVHRIPN